MSKVFFEDWFPTAIWSSANTAKETITALRKFYKFLSEHNDVYRLQSLLLNDLIKKHKTSWLNIYNQDIMFNDYDMSSYLDESLINDLMPEGQDELYDTLNYIIELKPWLLIDDRTLLLVVKEDIPYFVNIMGSEGYYTGLTVYKNITGLRNYLDIKQDNFDHKYEVMSFLYGFNIDLNIDNDLFPPFATIIDKGKLPRELTVVESTFLSEILKYVCQFVKSDYKISNPDLIYLLTPNQDMLTVTPYNLDKVFQEFEENTLYNFHLNEMQVKRIQKMKLGALVWEIAAIYLPPIETQDNLAIHIVILNHKNGDLIKVTNFEINDLDQGVCEFMIDLMMTEGKPQTVHLSTHTTDDVLHAVFKQFNIPTIHNQMDWMSTYKIKMFDYLLSADELPPNKTKQLSSLKKYDVTMDGCIASYSKKVLWEILKTLHLEVPKSSKKDKLLDIIYQTVFNPNKLMRMLLQCTEEENEYLQKLIDNDFILISENEKQFVVHFVDRALVFMTPIEDELKCWIPDDLKVVFSKIPEGELDGMQRTYNLVINSVTAAINLYGAIHLSKFKEILIQVINDKEFELKYDKTMDYLLPIILESPNYFYLKEDILYHEVFIHDEIKAYDLLNSEKPYYIPGLEIFFEYVNEDFREASHALEALQNYLKSKLHNDELIEDIIFEIEDTAETLNMDYLFSFLDQQGLEFNSQKDFDRFMNLYQKFSNNTRMWINHGHTPNEIRALGIRKQPKIGRNDPCPCSSGKKYKKCCGKNKL